MVKVKAHQAITSNLASGFGNKEKIISEHKVIEVMGKRRVKAWDKRKGKSFINNGREILGNKEKMKEGDRISLHFSYNLLTSSNQRSAEAAPYSIATSP